MTDRTDEFELKNNAMAFALRTATMGEDPQAILARAKIYEEYISGSLVQLKQ